MMLIRFMVVTAAVLVLWSWAPVQAQAQDSAAKQVVREASLAAIPDADETMLRMSSLLTSLQRSGAHCCIRR